MIITDENQKHVLRALITAMQAEREGHYFYQMAAGATLDPKGREVFGRLADEEIAHFEFLRAQHRSLLETGHVDGSARLGQASDLSGPSPIFSPRLRDRIKDAHYEMTALSVAGQLGRDAEAHYRREAEAAADPSVKRLFLELAAWEAGHYAAVTAQQDELKEGYWADSGFAPF
ncbi:MAG: ferritin family protein [Proteobacteria bacterium]|jgi:rubrerythrin|nr:ferritin family protein [Pseudomonadota bacterium]